MCFQRVQAPIQEELLSLTHTLSQCVARFFERRGLLESDAENSDLVYEQQEEDVMQQLYGHSVTCRIAVGAHQGRKVFTLQTLPPLADMRVRGKLPRWPVFPCTRGWSLNLIIAISWSDFADMSAGRPYPKSA